MTTARHETTVEARLITAIGAFKAFKGGVLLIASVGVFQLIGRDLESIVDWLVDAVHLAPDGRLVRWAYAQLDGLTDGKLRAIASVGLLYGALLCTEAYGLLMRRKWAEQLVVVATLLPVPVELYE